MFIIAFSGQKCKPLVVGKSAAARQEMVTGTLVFRIKENPLNIPFSGLGKKHMKNGMNAPRICDRHIKKIFSTFRRQDLNPPLCLLKLGGYS